MTGYDMKKGISLRVSHFWDLSYEQIKIRSRTRLKKGGLIVKKVVIETRDPNRKVYSITETGLEKLRRWLNKSARKESHKYEVLVKLFFGNQTSQTQRCNFYTRIIRLNSGIYSHYHWIVPT